MIRFSIPDSELNQTLIEQAAKNDAIIILPEYNNPELLIETYDEFIKESELTYSNGNRIQVMTYMDFLSREGNNEENLIISNPNQVLLEILNADEENVIFVESNELA